MPSITSPPPTTSSPYPSTADTTLANRQPRPDPADPRRTSRRTGRHGPAHGHLAPDRQPADPNPPHRALRRRRVCPARRWWNYRTETRVGLGALVARPGWVHWWPVRAGCTGGPSGLGALVARPGWVHWWPVRAGCTGGPSGLGALVARPGWGDWWHVRAGCTGG